MGMLKPSMASVAKVTCNIPSIIYWTASGIDRRIYFDAAFFSNCAREQIQVECDLIISGSLVGQHDSLGLYIPSATVLATGTHVNALHLTVIVDGVTKINQYATVVIVATTAGGGNTRKFLAIGDSNTAGNTWVTQTTTRDTADANYGLTKIGTKGSAPNQHEGISGKTVNYFYTDALSPFVFSGSFNFATYLSTNSLAMTSNDWVCFMLGTNDVVSATSDATVDSTVTAMITQLNAMITNIQSAVSGCRILISPVMPCSSDQADFNIDYGTGLSRDQARRNLHRTRTAFMAAFDTAAKRTAGVYVSLSGVVIDQDGDFSGSGVHPVAAGLNRLGDAIWQQVKALA